MTTLGVDVAQGGADDTVLAALHGTWFAPLIKRRGIDTTNGPAVAALVVEHVRDGAQVVIDLTGGWGGSARDHLAAQGMRVEPVVFSGASRERTRDGQLTFLNKRAELWWKFREALDPVHRRRDRAAAGPRLAAQLAAPTWTLRGNAIVIESKEEMRKRLGSVDRRCRCGDPRLVPARRRAAAAERSGGSIRGGRSGMDGGVRGAERAAALPSPRACGERGRGTARVARRRATSPSPAGSRRIAAARRD